MGCKELIEALRRAADEKIIAIWDEAESEADAVRAEISRKTELIREDSERKLSAMTGQKIARVLSEANDSARKLRLAAEKKVSDRLFELAKESLPLLRGDGYAGVFAVLFREFPPLPWKTVRINPGDAALARERFPDADIIEDANITGGIDAETERGAIRIVNTFEKRLERVWADVLPVMIRDVYAKLSK